MGILNDTWLVGNITGGNPIVKNLPQRNDWYDKDSPIQASSIDLHIGNIYIPGKTGQLEGSADKPMTLFALEPGQTAIVSTFEELDLPGDIAAIGFPPSRVSVKGLLMTNPGHIDPGFSGPLRFTVINMGKIDYVLRRHELIVTLILVQLQKVTSSYTVRTGVRKSRLPNQDDLNVLSPDFLNVRGRAEEVAKQEVKAAGLRIQHWQLVVGVCALIAAAFVTWISGALELKTRLAVVEKSLNVNGLEQKIESVDERLKAIEQQSKSTVGKGSTDTTSPPTNQGTK